MNKGPIAPDGWTAFVANAIESVAEVLEELANNARPIGYETADALRTQAQLLRDLAVKLRVQDIADKGTVTIVASTEHPRSRR